MPARASTDDDGRRWTHAIWNGIPCSSFLILRCCSSHFRDQGGDKPRLYPIRIIELVRRRVGAGLVPALASPHPHTIFGEGVTDVTAIYAWNRRRISNGGSSNGSVVFAYPDDAGEGGGAVRREDQGRDAAIDYRAGERYLPEYPGRPSRTATDTCPPVEAGRRGRIGLD